MSENGNGVERVDEARGGPYLLGGHRFKLAAAPRRHAAEFRDFPEVLAGQWVALVDATDNRHMEVQPLLGEGRPTAYCRMGHEPIWFAPDGDFGPCPLCAALVRWR